jgi:hypothetical protein
VASVQVEVWNEFVHRYKLRRWPDLERNKKLKDKYDAEVKRRQKREGESQ